MSRQITYRVIKESSHNGTLSGTMVELWHAPEDSVNLPWQVWRHSYTGRATSDPVIIAAFGNQQLAEDYLQSLPDARHPQCDSDSPERARWHEPKYERSGNEPATDENGKQYYFE